MRLALVALAAHAAALLVAPSSRCADRCGNLLSYITTDEISCYDAAYAETASGQTFAACAACELDSTAADSVAGANATDLAALLCR
jgi:hypothetical protein